MVFYFSRSCCFKVKSTHPKRSKVTISFPGAMLNIMVKVGVRVRHSLE